MKPKETSAAKKRGRGRPLGVQKIPVTIMLPRTTKDQLDAISVQSGVDRGTMVDEALQRHFAHSTPPDFAERFARPPLGVRVGDRLVDMLLAERDES